jgi:hypothetical protein
MGKIAHIVLNASDRPVYKPGAVVRQIRGGPEMLVPELQDFADEAFLSSHCFSLEADEGADDIVLRFRPIRNIETRDIAGTASFRAGSYVLREVDVHTTGIPSQFAKGMDSVRVVTRYRDLMPGVPVLSRLESFLQATPGETADASRVSWGEIQTLVGVSWLKTAP